MFLETESKNLPQPLAGNIDPKSGVNLYDQVDYGTHVECVFAAQFENKREHVKLFSKLSRRFRVCMPVGEYSLDWAIICHENGTQ